MTLDSGDLISIRDRLHLLQALSVVDFSRNYHRIDFREGSFRLKTSGGGMELTDLVLKSDDQTRLEGKLKKQPRQTRQRFRLESLPTFSGTK